MSFETLKLTDKGKEMLLRSLEGQQLVFTSVHIGDGEISGPDAIPALEDLVSSIKSVDIIKAQRNTDYMTVEAYFKNDEIPRSFDWREIGVFVADPDNPDDRSSDILFVYQNAYDTAEYISISTAEIIEKTVRVNVFVGEAENISAVIDSSVVFVTKAEFDQHTSSNAHLPAGGTEGKILKAGAEGEPVWGEETKYGDASEVERGLVNTEEQTFGGDKTFAGKVICNGASDITAVQARGIYAGAEELEPGVSPLPSGVIYLCFEE